MAKEDFSDFSPVSKESFDDFEPVAFAKPKRSAFDYVRDVGAGVLKIGGTAVKSGADLAQLATGGRVGADTSNAMKRGMGVIDQMIGSDALNAEKAAFAQVMANPDSGVSDALKSLYQNPMMAADMGVSTIGSMMLPMGAVGAVGKIAPIGAKAATGIAVGTGAAQNAAETYTQTDGSQADKYKAAAISGVISAALGKLAGGGVEGQIARQMTGAGAGVAGVAGVKGVLKGAVKEGGQEFGEEAGNVFAQNIGEGAPIDVNAMMKQGAVGAALGASIGGGVSTYQAAQPTSGIEAIAKIINEAAAQAEPAYRVADPQTQAQNIYQTLQAPQAQPAPAVIEQMLALPYDETVMNRATLVADQQGNVQQQYQPDVFARQQKELRDAEIGLTPDVRRAQEQRQASAEDFSDFEPVSQAEPELLQMLRRAGWTPQQQVFNEKPALDAEQARQLEQALGQDVEAEYQAGVKDEIRRRLGLTEQPDTQAENNSYAQNPLLRLIASEGGINLDERSDYDVDPKRQTKTGQTMPNPYNIGGNPLFRKGGREGDMLVELLQQNGYLTEAEIEQADANNPGGSYQLAYDLVSKAIQDPSSIGLERGDAPAKRAELQQAKQLDSQASQYGIDTSGMDERQTINAINRVERRAAQPQTPDFQSRKLSRVEQSETARGRALDAQLSKLEQLSDYRDLNDIERSRFAEVFFEEDGTPVIVTRQELEQNEAYEQANNDTQGQAEGGDQRLAAREPQKDFGSSESSRANDEPPSRQPQNDTLTSYTEADVRQIEERAAQAARKEERQRIEQERKADVDAQRDDFTLTGSDRSADQGAARGQNALFTVAEKEQTNTPEFKRWFGDSKVVDDQGRPLVIYHGTDADFNTFKPSEKFGGAYFASESKSYANTMADELGGNVMPLYVSLQNPKIVNFENYNGDAIESAMTDGNVDGLIAIDIDGTKQVIIAFDPAQIKSAIGNNGEFDPKNNSILATQSNKAIAAYRQFQGQPSASQAKADAEQVLGFASPVPVLTKADQALADKNVPMWYDLDTKEIYYNTAFKDHDAARDAQWMAEEIMHAIDHMGGNNLLSKGSGMFSEGAEIRQELESAYKRSQLVKAMLKYPLDYKQEFTDDRIAAELFARAGVLFKGFPDALRAAAPKTYEVYRDIFERIGNVRGEVRQSAANSPQESSGQRSDGSGNATTGEGGQRGQADSELARIRGIVAERLGSSGEGGRATLGSASLEARAPWDVPEPGRIDAMIRDWQDNKIDIRRTVDAIKKQGSTIADNANPYLRDELYIGRVRDQLDKLADDAVTPLLRAISNSGIKPETVNRYLWARHARERNMQMAKVNGDVFTEDLNYAGMSSKDAKAEIAKLASTPDYIKLQKIAAIVDDITRETRAKIVQDGLEDPAVIKAWEGAYKFYVPLQRDVEESGKRGAGFTVKGSESRRAVGSDKKATNIIANVIAQAESAIIRSEKAKVGRSVLELAEQNPNPDFWQVDTPPTERVIDPRTGMAINRVKPNYTNMDNVFVVKENGKERFIVFNESNARAIEFARNLKNMDAAELDPVSKFVGKGTRYLANWVTSRNPLFWATNFVRDVQGVAFNLESTPIAGKQAQVMRDIAPALYGVAQQMRGNSGKWADAAARFKAAGGQTGFMQTYENSVERMGEISKDIERMVRKAYDPRKFGMALIDMIDNANNVIENGVRLAVFVQAEAKGLTQDQAASIAKNISVNFNRKGNSARLNSWYMFANANIQGNARLIEGIAKSKRSQIAAGLLVTAGAALAMMNYATSGEDEESRKKRYELVPEFERERNWIVFIPGSDNYVKIPLPLGPHILFNAGRTVAEFGAEKDASAIEKAASFASSVFASFNPIGGGLPSKDLKGVAQTATPTIFRPLVDMAVNQNFAGTPIAKESAFGKYEKPAYKQAKDSTPGYWKEASKGLNDLTGGDSVKPGDVNIAPEHLAYLLKGYITPGIAQTVDRVAAQATSKKETKLADRPGVSKFYGEIDEGERSRAARQTAQKDLQRAGEYEAYLKEGQRDKAAQVLREWGAGDQGKGRKLYSQAKDYDRNMKQVARMMADAKKAPENRQEDMMKRAQERRDRINAVFLRSREALTGEEE